MLYPPWVVSPKLALVVIEAEGSAASLVPNLDALPRVQVVPRVLGVLLDRAGWIIFILNVCSLKAGIMRCYDY